MKIAWFTPFHSKSAIGEVSRLICEEFSKTDEVDIWTFNREDNIHTSVPVIHFDSHQMDVRKLEKYDHVVYNMGNYAGNHKEIWEVMQKYTGIVLLHDQLMHNFFVENAFLPEYGGSNAKGQFEYLKLMRTCYGLRGEIAGKAKYKPYYGKNEVRLWESDAALAYPLIEPLLNIASAVFTHASFFEEAISHHFYGPTGYAYLPHIPKPYAKNIVLPLNLTDDSKALIVSNGIVHPIKRIDRVAEMLLANPDIAARVNYIVIGDYGGPYGEYLSSLATGALQGCLHLLGYQPNDIMETFLHKADFCINLRYPNSEVCSKSLIEQMATGNPVIVLNSGIFGELPDDCVVKINLENEISAMAIAFRSLLNDKQKRLEIGRRAVDFVEKNCSPKEYVSRLKTFLKKVRNTIILNQVVNESVRLNRVALSGLTFDQQSAPWMVDTAWRQLSKVCGAIPAEPTGRKVLGLWFGFPYAEGLRREGITRFLVYMLMAMLERYPIECEIWAYSFNEEEIRISFDSILKDERSAQRVKIVTEKNYKDVLELPAHESKIEWEINENLDNLAEAAKKYSKATSFITAIVYLDNLIGTGKRLFVPVHDLSIHEHYNDFVEKDPLYKARFVDIRSRAENLARAGAFMFSNSEYVRREHALKYISSLHQANTAVVYLPVNIPQNILEHLVSEKDIREKFGLKKAYIFYPTQVRPYKNVTVLVEALASLAERGVDVNLVLTGNPADVPEVEMTITRLKLKDRIICVSDVTENELYSLYRYASAAAVPTLFEGGFPWQACEALFMDTPLVLSDIPIVRERIEFLQMVPEECGINLFDPHNPAELAAALERVLANREKALLAQIDFKDKLLSYTWHDAVGRYHDIFFPDPQAERV